MNLLEKVMYLSIICLTWAVMIGMAVEIIGRF